MKSFDLPPAELLDPARTERLMREFAEAQALDKQHREEFLRQQRVEAEEHRSQKILEAKDPILRQERKEKAAEAYRLKCEAATAREAAFALRRQQISTLRQQGLTYRVIAGKFRITVARVRQILDKEECLKKYGPGLSVRVRNCLWNGGFVEGEIRAIHVEKLLQTSEGELLRIPNFGRRSLGELKTWLAKRGLTLKAVGRNGHG